MDPIHVSEKLQNPQTALEEKKTVTTVQLIAACSIWSGLILGSINMENDRCIKVIQDPSFTIIPVLLILSGTLAIGLSSK